MHYLLGQNPLLLNWWLAHSFFDHSNYQRSAATSATSWRGNPFCVAEFCNRLGSAADAGCTHAAEPTGGRFEMSDFVTRAAPDRSKIDTTDEQEVKYWVKHLGVSRDELAAAIAKVGNAAAAVRKQRGK
jgi:hypothetical protein